MPAQRRGCPEAIPRDTAFNSLFEMHDICGLENGCCGFAFNSLFEMLFFEFVFVRFACFYVSFNSLFEMLKQLLAVGYSKPGFSFQFSI